MFYVLIISAVFAKVVLVQAEVVRLDAGRSEG